MKKYVKYLIPVVMMLTGLVLYYFADIYEKEFEISQSDKINPPKADVILGSKNPKHIIYFLSDPYCPYCKAQYENLSFLLDKRKDVQIRVILVEEGSEIALNPCKEGMEKALNNFGWIIANNINSVPTIIYKDKIITGVMSVKDIENLLSIDK